MSGVASAAPEVSVVVPCRNRTNMLRDCMRGLAAQDFGLDRFEVVLIDNCSTEDLSLVADEARAMGLRLTFARTTEDRGPAPARNLGVSLARAPIIAFTDSDCRPSPGWLTAALPRFSDQEVAFVGGPVHAKPEQEVTLTTRLGCLTDQEHPTFPTANLLMRRNLFVEFGGFDASLSFVDPWDRTVECADSDLAWRILEAGHKRAFEPAAIVFHEQETQTILHFMFDPSRLFVLPALVRRHPGLRRELLTFGFIFNPVAASIYLLAPFALVVAWYAPALLLVIPALMLARALLRTRSLDPGRIAAALGRQMFHLPRMVVTAGALLYGSIRFRCLVI